MEAKDALVIVAVKAFVSLFSLIGNTPTHGRVGMLTAKTGPHT